MEDDHTLRALMRMLLEDEGLKVVEASTGLQAVERFGAEHIDLVLLDVRLPGLSGFEVCRQLRRTQRRPHHHGHRAAGQSRCGRWARARRGRLRHEAVQRSRVDGASANATSIANRVLSAEPARSCRSVTSRSRSTKVMP